MKTRNIFYLLLLLTTSVFAQEIKINNLIDAKSDNDGTQNGSSIFLGVNAGKNDNAANNRNIGIGYHCLFTNTNGKSNLAIGNFALTKNIESRNIGLGDGALSLNTTGTNNIAIGVQSGTFFEGTNFNSYTNNSIFIGNNSKAFSQNDQNEIVIGHNTIGNGSNSITLGSNKNSKTILTGNIGLGTKNPKQKLDVIGNIRLLNGFGNVHLYLDGSKGNSDIIYQKNGKFGGSVGYNTEKDYLFLYNGGNVKIKKGNIIVDKDYKYKSPKHYSKQITPYAFTPSKYKQKIHYQTNGATTFLGLDGIDIVNLFAPIDLPQGAKLTSFRLTSALYNCVIEAKLVERHHLNAQTKTLAKITDSGTHDIKETSTTANANIENTHNHYFIFIRIVIPNTKNFLDFYGVHIDYTINQITQ